MGERPVERGELMLGVVRKVHWWPTRRSPRVAVRTRVGRSCPMRRSLLGSDDHDWSAYRQHRLPGDLAPQNGGKRLHSESPYREPWRTVFYSFDLPYAPTTFENLRQRHTESSTENLGVFPFRPSSSASHEGVVAWIAVVCSWGRSCHGVLKGSSMHNTVPLRTRNVPQYRPGSVERGLLASCYRWFGIS